MARVEEVKEAMRSSRPRHGGLGYSGNGGGAEVTVRVEAAVGWEAMRSSHNNNGGSSSSRGQGA